MKRRRPNSANLSPDQAMAARARVVKLRGILATLGEDDDMFPSMMEVLKAEAKAQERPVSELFFFFDETERISESQNTKKTKLQSHETRESLLSLHFVLLHGGHHQPQRNPKSPPETRPEHDPQCMTMWTTVALTWCGTGREHARNSGFPTTTVHQFQWPTPLTAPAVAP